MSDKPFLDSNIVLYAFSNDEIRSHTAETLLADGGEISVQTLNEFIFVARQKLCRTWEEIRSALAILRTLFPEPVAITIDTQDRAVQIAEQYGYSIFDSLVIAAALEAGAETLYSEEMQNGQEIEGLVIRNPFLPR
jgi:predicted nucleic acid-binding protein